MNSHEKNILIASIQVRNQNSASYSTDLSRCLSESALLPFLHNSHYHDITVIAFLYFFIILSFRCTSLAIIILSYSFSRLDMSFQVNFNLQVHILSLSFCYNSSDSLSPLDLQNFHESGFQKWHTQGRVQSVLLPLFSVSWQLYQRLAKTGQIPC